MKESKRADILNHSRQLFNEYGITKVTVEEICKEAKVSKATFYKYFTNKDGVAQQIASQFVVDAKQRFQDLVKCSKSFEELIIGLLDLKDVFMKEYSEKFLIDLYQNSNKDIQRTLSSLQTQSLENSMMIYELGIEQDKIRNKISPEFFHYQLKLIDNIRTDPSVIEMYPYREERNRIIFEQFFYGLIKLKNN